MNNIATFALNAVLALCLAPLLSGIINRVKAKFSGRHGKPILQLYFDLAKLLKKSEVISTTTSWVFQTTPAISLAATVCALLLLPLGGSLSPFRFHGDVIFAAYLLGTGRFAMILAALDTASPFEGMGASREATFSALAEPVLFLCGLAMMSAACLEGLPNELSLSTILTGVPGGWLAARPELVIVPLVLFLLLLVENCRIPVDDPNTHLELTMIHEAMILDHSGPNLAFILYGASLKLWIFSAMVTGVLIPQLPGIAGMLVRIAGILAVAVVVGIVESIMARLRMPRIPQLLGSAAVLATLALILTLVVTR